MEQKELLLLGTIILFVGMMAELFLVLNNINQGYVDLKASCPCVKGGPVLLEDFKNYKIIEVCNGTKTGAACWDSPITRAFGCMEED